MNHNPQGYVMPEQYIFNDLYGSELAKSKFSAKRNYTYFTTLLKLHNKYHNNPQIYDNIFKSQDKSPQKNQQQLYEKSKQYLPIKKAVYVNMQVLNPNTFKLKKTIKLENINKSVSISPDKQIQKDRMRSITQDKQYIKKFIKGLQKMQKRNKSFFKGDSPKKKKKIPLREEILQRKAVQIQDTLFIIRQAQSNKLGHRMLFRDI